jgi:hypothetical protein
MRVGFIGTVPSVRLLTTSSATFHGPTRTRRYQLPNDVTAPSSPSLLFLANLLSFAAIRTRRSSWAAQPRTARPFHWLGRRGLAGKSRRSAEENKRPLDRWLRRIGPEGRVGFQRRTCARRRRTRTGSAPPAPAGFGRGVEFEQRGNALGGDAKRLAVGGHDLSPKLAGDTASDSAAPPPKTPVTSKRYG